MQVWNPNNKRKKNLRFEIAIGTNTQCRSYSYFWWSLTIFLFGLCVPAILQAQNPKKPHPTSHAGFTIGPAADWTAMFNRKVGWTGGDGIYSIKLPNAAGHHADSDKGQVLFLFSDSVIDSLVDGKSATSGFTMIHNAAAVLHGPAPNKKNLDFHWQKNKEGKPASLFMPPTASGKLADDSIYYWLGDGIAWTDKSTNSATITSSSEPALAIFAYRMISFDNSPFGFKDIGNDLIITNRNLQVLKTIELPALAHGNFGAGIYRQDTSHIDVRHAVPYIYIYGVHGMGKSLVVARATDKDLITPANWQYYDGAGWTTDIKKCSDVTAHVSNELSVTRTPDGQYALIFQLDGIQPYIGMRMAPTPYGPFGQIDTIWHCPEPAADSNQLVYNAKAHPVLSPEGGLLISYNVNSLTFLKTLKESPNFYRPRFLLLKWNKAKKEAKAEQDGPTQ